MNRPPVTLTNAEKVLYPATGTTKADVFAYYTEIAPVLVPHTAGRPATRKRWPDGVSGSSFFEKHLADSAPDWLHRGTVAHRSGTTTYPIIDGVDALAWIAQQAALEIHVPQWRFVDARPGPATRLVLDLDPGDGVSLAQTARVARAIRALLADIDLAAYPVSSGSKGLHVYSPLDRPVSSSGASTLARHIAEQLQRDLPELVTVTMAKAARAGKVFVDWSQNNAAKTTIAPYSLRGREHPTVAAPRSWAELDDTGLAQLRYDEVCRRVARDGDLLAGLDPAASRGGAPADRLAAYRRKRNAAKTSEPIPAATGGSGEDSVFVVQEHHARRLHYDLRLERNGVLMSWAVPKNLPHDPGVNHLAVRTEDHPLEYAEFEGTIPAGQYGAGTVTLFDSGRYDTEKFDDDEIIVVLHGARLTGRYALIRTDGDQWLAHRMKDQRQVAFTDLEPMLATAGQVDGLGADRWAFDGKWDGYRMLVYADADTLRLRSRSGRDVTAEYPGLHGLADELDGHRVILDGEVVAPDRHGVPSFAGLQNRAAGRDVAFWAFDLLHLDGRSLLRVRYRDRRRLLETLAAGTGLTVPALLPGDGAEALAAARERGWEGVVAKRWSGAYHPGRRSRSWIKDKLWRTQEIVIGGWRRGERPEGIGSLLMGVPEDGGVGAGGLVFVGKVGTGFTERALEQLAQALAPLRTDRSPFTERLRARDRRGVTFVRPELVGEVRFGERTADGRLRHPSWRGLRPDKSPDQVVTEW
ncbi:ATP-dependent DNA ligase [Mycolicibacillus parakoreensis]|uniref:DNA ligase (ATP) n=1 Tax=Mycolicibacillus parakoreensis TaxID=1069221 RepID=A0ABY3U7M3_9MYCO|nr:ATP-dependent DNA ligase [Mycolicibacillus parakoreensis]MCV7315243.1 ATP-dependent DNA ligase [Mycolicibacillus parakoreensis]ULN53424.1 ATP-dependent DNA ligase [Mycolicibacillus parakoreensis]